MSHFAALVVRSHGQWKGADTEELDLSEVDDIEDVADLMRDAMVDDGPALLFVEEDDEWFGIVRVDGAGEPTTFISDARVIPVSELAGVLFDDLMPDEGTLDALDIEEPLDEAASVDDEEESASVKPAAEPKGVSDVLADLGISGSDLLALCAEEGALPADVITAICERLGCADEIEVYR